MRTLITILTLCISTTVLGQLFGTQDVGIINDSDGFTLIREHPEQNSKVIDTLFTGEFFRYQKTETSDWYKVYKMWRTNGYVHKSRIQGLKSLGREEQYQLIDSIFDQTLIMYERGRKTTYPNRNVSWYYHEEKFTPVLVLFIHYMCESYDEKLLRKFLDLMITESGSADESPATTLGFIYKCHPDLVDKLVDEYDSRIVSGNLAFGQDNVGIKSTKVEPQDFLIGTWRSPRSLARHSFAFNITGKVTFNFYGDITSFEKRGDYTRKGDTIYIAYERPDSFERAFIFRCDSCLFPPDTLVILNSEKLRYVDRAIMMYNKDRDVTEFNVDSMGVLNFTIRDFGEHISLYQQIMGRGWRLVDHWTNPNGDYLELKDYQLPLHSGRNEFSLQVHQIGRAEYLRRFIVESKKEKVTIENKRVTDWIRFSESTYYELIYGHANKIVTGTADKIDCSEMESGIYFLYYNNDFAKIKIKKKK